jgi:hypothetical protein
VGKKCRVLRHLAVQSGVVVLSLIAIGGVGAALATDQKNQMSSDGWRLIRTKSPGGGTEKVSINHLADITRSDLDLAGLAFRCGEAGLDAVLVVVPPFPPHTPVQATIETSHDHWQFDARVVAPGAELLLPPDAMVLAPGPWSAAGEIAVKVASPERSFSGFIRTDGVGQALTTLAANCPEK